MYTDINSTHIYPHFMSENIKKRNNYMDGKTVEKMSFA